MASNVRFGGPGFMLSSTEVNFPVLLLQQTRRKEERRREMFLTGFGNAGEKFYFLHMVLSIRYMPFIELCRSCFLQKEIFPDPEETKIA